MSMEHKLAELERRRDAVLGEMDENATQLGNYLRVQYSPKNILRRHIGPAMGVAAALGTLAAGVNAPRGGLLQALWSRVVHGHRAGKKPAESSEGRTAGVPQETQAAPDPAAAQQPGLHPLIDAAEPIVRTFIVGAAQAIPWRSLLARVLEKRDKHVNGHDPS